MTALHCWHEGVIPMRLVSDNGHLRIQQEIRGEWVSVRGDRIEVTHALEAVTAELMRVRNQIEGLKKEALRRLTIEAQRAQSERGR